MVQKSAREEDQSLVHVLGNGGDMAQNTARAHMGSAPWHSRDLGPEEASPGGWRSRALNGALCLPPGPGQRRFLRAAHVRWGRL